MSNWEQGKWERSIQPVDVGELARIDPVPKEGSVVCRWNVPVMLFKWEAFPETLAHREIFMSLN